MCFVGGGGGSRERTQWIKPNLKIVLIYALVRSLIQSGQAVSSILHGLGIQCPIMSWLLRQQCGFTTHFSVESA